MDLVKPLAWLVVLVALLLGILALSGTYVIQPNPWGVPSNNQNVELGSTKYVPPQPAAKPEDMVAIRDKAPFQVLISHAASGFEPKEVSVTKGQTVRFTNNSRNAIWIAATGPTLYPRSLSACGLSQFDSCRALQPGEYWQFTFERTGSWSFKDKIGGQYAGVVHVVP